jgi:hypothetical protein
MALLNTQHRVLFIVSLVLLIAVAGCSTHHSALKPSPDTPAVIYAIPQSQAFAIAREAVLSATTRCGAESVHIDEISRGGEIWIQGYEAGYRSSFYRFLVVRHLYIIPTTGIAGSGQQIDGFRFEITYDLFRHPEPWTVFRGQRGGCEKTLVNALQTALDATGTTTTVTNLRVRPYGEGRAGP